jgi:WD40 repeat protein
MVRREVNTLVVKPLCAIAFVGLVVFVLRLATPRQALEGNPIQSVLYILLATLCVSPAILDGCRRNAVASHAVIGLLAGLVLGLAFVRLMASVLVPIERKELESVALQLTLLLTAIGGTVGLVVGVFRYLVAKRLGNRASFRDARAHSGDSCNFWSRVLARPRTAKCTIFGAGLVVISFLCITSSPTIDSRTLDECLLVSKRADSEPAESIGSTNPVWQPSGVGVIAFSSDSKYLATGGSSGTIGIWNTGDWTRAGQLTQEGRVERLAFSPDHQWLYAAGEDGRQKPLLCRFRWQAGERDKVFTGHTGPVDGMALSADGRTLVTSSCMRDELRLWNTTSGKLIHSFACRSPKFVYAPRRNFIIEWDRFGPGYSAAYLNGAEVPLFFLPCKPMAAAFGPDEQLLVVAAHRDSVDRGPEVALATYRPAERRDAARQTEYRVLTQIRFPGVWDDEAAIAVSPDGQQVAVASGDVRLAMYAMPDLKLIKEFRFPVRQTRSQRIHQLVYSSDGKWLAAAQELRTTPRLFNVATANEVTVNQGSGNIVRDLRFSPDGRTLRTVDHDGTVCLWNATTMNVLRRFSIPAGYLVGDIRPSGGKYALCSNAVDPTRPVQVVDLSTGQSICEATLPFSWNDSVLPRQSARVSRVYWLSHQEALCVGWFLDRAGASHHWWRFNYQTGKILGQGMPRAIQQQGVYFELEPNDVILNGWGEVDENGDRLFLVAGGGKGGPPTVAGRIDLRTFQATDLGKIDRPANGSFGLVPGGKYFHLGLHIYNRRSLRLVAAKEFPGDDVGVGLVTFSPDGGRYAAALSRWREPTASRPVVLVHETLTNRLLAAFTLSAAAVQLQFSPDGTQLAIADDRGTLKLRSISTDPPSLPVQ